MKHRIRPYAVALMLLAALTLAACSGNNHMYRHNRSHCDCPTF